MSEILINITRGNTVENIHRGDIAVVDSQGNLIAYKGDWNKFTFMRSCAKPLQASTVLESGAAEHFHLEDKEIAIMCASHYAEKFHTDAVEGILNKIGLQEEHFKLGTSYSLNENIREEMIRRGEAKRKLFNNCSGKHAGMLALAVFKDYDRGSYMELENPVQQAMIKTVAEYCEYDIDKIEIGIDGCGVPVFALPLFNMALSYAKLADRSKLAGERKKAAEKLVRCMTGNPEMIAGTGGFCSELMRHTKGRILAKLGADAVYCFSLLDRNMGIAVKIEDGNVKVLSSAVMEILIQLNALTEEEIQLLKSFYIKENINTAKCKVGEIRPVFRLDFTTDK
ncbi:MAG: hypothetical protein K0Q65_1110 [Clostridia bacterium]|jgi:L-asparaginase II|nr:hypothetical protein [Clostridia bacterium]